MTRESLRESIEEHFGKIPDQRVVTRSTHKLVDIIAIAILAILCGADGWVAIETYGKAKEEWLKTFLELPNGIPSHDTFGRIFSQLDPEILEKSFQCSLRSRQSVRCYRTSSLRSQPGRFASATRLEPTALR